MTCEARNFAATLAHSKAKNQDRVEQALGSVIGRWGSKCLVPRMRTGRKKHKPSDWQFAIEQIGRELRKLYPPPEDLLKADLSAGGHRNFRHRNPKRTKLF
jgi:hypothetical protein